MMALVLIWGNGRDVGSNGGTDYEVADYREIFRRESLPAWSSIQRMFEFVTMNTNKDV